MRTINQTKGNLHLSRKTFHVVSILVILLCMVFLPAWACWTIYFLVGLPTVFIDYFRRHLPKLNDLFLKVNGPLMRQSELHKMSGSSYAVIGIGLTFLIFPKPTCFLAVLFLAIGDPTASGFGLLFGKRKIFRQKSFNGTFAALCVCSLAAFIFLSLYPKAIGPSDDLWTRWMLSIALGTIGALSELLTFCGLDDNLSQPLISASLISLLLWQLGGVVYG